MGAGELAAGGSLVTPPATDSSRNSSTANNRPVTESDLSGGLDAEKIQPIIRKRRGGSRRACNECKQQKVRDQSSANPGRYQSDISGVHEYNC